MSRSKRSAKAKSRRDERPQSSLHTQTRHDISRIKASSSTSHAYHIGAPVFTNGGLLMPDDVLARHEMPNASEALHLENYHGYARSSLAPPADTPMDLKAVSHSSSSSTSGDEIVFVGKDPKARQAALEESIDSDWSIAQQKLRKDAQLKAKSITADQSMKPSKALRRGSTDQAEMQAAVHTSSTEGDIIQLPILAHSSESMKKSISMRDQLITTAVVIDQLDQSVEEEEDFNMMDLEGESLESGVEEDDDVDDDDEAILRDYMQNILADKDMTAPHAQTFLQFRNLDMMDEPTMPQPKRKAGKSATAARNDKFIMSTTHHGSGRSNLTPTRRKAGPRLKQLELNSFDLAISTTSPVTEHDDEAGEVDDIDQMIATIVAEEDWVDMESIEDFDVMDFERPSLQKRKKKGKLAAVPQISDEELQEKLSKAWENDRSKKRDRKIQREELRAQGRLKRRNAKYIADDSSDSDHGQEEDDSNLKEKYADGMLKEDFFKELLRFCTTDRTILSLPPFDANIRRLIHTIVGKLGLKSKSHGKGVHRYLVITKSNRQFCLEQKMFNRCKKFIKSNFLYRQDVGSPPLTVHVPRASRANRSTGGGSANTGGSSRVAAVKAGDRIGEGAPELHDARGSAKARAMMEKMGWSAGQSLGTEENKGILNPVEQVVWYRKAGLG